MCEQSANASAVLQVVAAVVQALAAVAALAVTIWLARVARQTLQANNRMAESSERQIAVMFDQMDLEHQPNIVVSNIRWPEGVVEVFNLGRWPVLIYRVDLEVRGQGGSLNVSLAAPSGGFTEYRAPESFHTWNGKRVKGDGTLSLYFFHGSTGRKAFCLTGIKFRTQNKSGGQGVEILSQGVIEPTLYGLPG